MLAGATVTPGAGAREIRLRLFARDLARGLVEAQAEEGGMAQPAVGGPFHERDLCHELGSTHVAAAGMPFSGSNGDVSRTSGARRSDSSRSVARVKPVPTLPA